MMDKKDMPEPMRKMAGSTDHAKDSMTKKMGATDKPQIEQMRKKMGGKK